VARILVVHDTDPALFFDLTEDDETADCDGACSGCGYTISEGGSRFNGLADAVHAAIVHLDQQH
jgi:hypothetical protein